MVFFGEGITVNDGMNRAIAYRVLRTIFGPLLILWFSPAIIGNEFIPNKGAAVIAGNHKHALDPILVDLCTKRTVYTLAKKELHDGIFGWLFRAVGSIPVDLNAKRNPDALHTAVSYLREGNLINVSPEAERNYTEEILLPFKFGAVVMAKRAGCQLVPYAIVGDYKFRSKNLKIIFQEPIDTFDLDVEESNELLFNTIKNMLMHERSERTGHENA